MMKWIAVVVSLIFILTSDLLRRSIWQSRCYGTGFCHAWTSTAIGISGRDARRGFCSPVPWKNRHYRRESSRNPRLVNSHINSHKWTGDMAPFAEFATHVKVGKEDVTIPTTVDSAILRSMTALGSSSLRLSEDGKSYANYNQAYNSSDINTNNVNNNTNNPLVLIVQDDNNKEYNETDGSRSNARIIARQLKDSPHGRPMTPRQLLYLGCVWYLPADDCLKNQKLRTTRPDKSVKPSRLSLSEASMMLCEGDYLRIHHTPRRFPQVYKVDWSFPINKESSYNISSSINSRQESEDCTTLNNNNNNINNNNNALPVVVQQQGPGYCIIDKPPIVPVYATVDNAVENVAHQLLLSLEQQRQQQNLTSFDDIDQKRDDGTTNSTGAHYLQRRQQHQQQHQDVQQRRNQGNQPYLVPPQRLDVNTSGLLVLATSPEFAAYFGSLLRRKTESSTTTRTGSNGTAASTSSPTIQKGYKCLVCIQPDEIGGESVLEAWKRISNLQQPKPPAPSSPLITADSNTNSNANNTMIVRHYLEASDRAPKLFVDSIPKDDDGSSKWYECLMEITDVGEPFPLYDATNNKNEMPSLVDNLWPKVGGCSSKNRMPPTTRAVAEVRVSLLTGRTHQIRGQLSKLGFPIVGDEQYGGALPLRKIAPSKVEQQHHQKEDVSRSTEDNPQLLALQCCHVCFRDAEYKSVWSQKKKRDILKGHPSRSGRWVRETLHSAWWTPFLEVQPFNE
jgi:23S rRNA-/tRNA-specific pseudouridylate synthase